jgi:hypothetical protein
VVLDVEDACRLTGTFQILAELEELPRLPVRHGAVGDAVQQLIDALDLTVELTAILSYSSRPGPCSQR